MKPNSSSMPSTPATMSSSPPTRFQVPRLVLNSAWAAMGTRQPVALLLWHITRSSELSSLIELRAGPLAGSARKMAPLLRADRNSCALCSRARAALLLTGVQDPSKLEVPLQSAWASSRLAMRRPAARRRGASRAGEHARQPRLGEVGLHLAQPAPEARRRVVEQIDREAPLEHHDQRVDRPHQRHPQRRDEQVLHGDQQLAGADPQEPGVDVNV